MRKSEHWVKQHKLNNMFFENCMYLELTWYRYHYLILFLQKNYKKEAQMFYQNHSLALHTVAVDIFCKPIFRNHWTWTWHLGLPHWAWINFMIYRTWTQKLLELPYWTRLIFRYIGVRLEKCLDYLTGFGLILWHIGLGLEKHLN